MQMDKVEPSTHALEVAHELCEWERLMWAVLWDTQPDNAPRVRHLCLAVGPDQKFLEHPALFMTKREALAHIRRHFDWCQWSAHRARPHNNRLPKPYRLRVRITIPAEAAPDA
jgi:hypothetical protein